MFFEIFSSLFALLLTFQIFYRKSLKNGYDTSFLLKLFYSRLCSSRKGFSSKLTFLILEIASYFVLLSRRKQRTYFILYFYLIFFISFYDSIFPFHE